LQPYGCVAHGLNLLAKDISSIESIAIIVNKGKEIVKEIILSHRLDAIFKEKQIDKKITLKLPVCTRWGSHVIFLNSIIKNRSALRSVMNLPNICYLVQPRYNFSTTHFGI